MSEYARRFDIDWLRVLAVLLLVPFHAALIFNLHPDAIVYYKGHVESKLLIQIASFLHVWHMPLLFFLSGASTWFALGIRSSEQYVHERIQRLLVPFVFGLFVFVPFMTYIQKIRQVDAPSLAQHYRIFFTQAGDLTGVDGKFTPAHLWFVLFLFVFSLVGLPLFLFLKKTNRFISGFSAFFSQPGLIFLLVIPLALTAALNILGDKNPVYYFAVFICGYILSADFRLQQAIDRQMLPALILGIVSYSGYLFLYTSSEVGYANWIVTGLLYQFARWSWVLAFIGLGHRYLDYSGPGLHYLRASSYPFYIVHLPICTLVSWLVIPWKVPIAVTYSVIVFMTIVLSFGLYEIFKRVRPLRFLLGMK